MKHAIIAIFLLLAAATIVRAGDPTPFGNLGDAIDMESLLPSEEGLIRIEVSGVDARDFLARFMGDTLFVPFTTLCDFLRIKSEVAPDQSRMRGQLPPAGDFEISRVTNTATIGTRTITFTPAAIRVVAGEVYVEQSVLMEIFGLSAFYDPANLKLRISPDEKLPVVQWKRSEERYGLLGGKPSQAARSEFPIERSFFGTPALNWTLANSLNDKIVSTSGSLFYGQQFLWGTLEVTGSGALGNSLASEKAHGQIDAVRWIYQMPNSSVLTQVQLGTFDLPNGSRVHGAGLTNVPLTPRTDYGNYILQGMTRPGWTVELYDGNRLVDMTRADDDGRYSFKILMDYGTVDRTTREVGPYGESILQQHRLQFDQSMIPTGEVEYDVRYGADTLRTHSRGAGSARLGVGVFDFLTLGAEMAYRTDDITAWHGDSIQPRAMASVWLGGSSSIGLHYGIRSKLAGASFATTTAENISLQASVDSFSVDRRTFGSALGFSLPIGPISLGGSATYAKRTLGTEYSAEPQISGYVGGISFVGSTKLAWRRIQTTEIDLPTELANNGAPDVSSSLRVMVTPAAGMLLSAFGRYNMRSAAVEQLDFSGYYQFNEQFGLTLNYTVPGLNWQNALIQAQLSINLQPFRATLASYHSNGITSGSSYVQGGILLSPHGVRLYADPVVGQSAVLIDAFNDRNGNGVRDDGEELLDAPKARLTVASSEMSSEDGMFRLLPANRECQVEIDRWSFASEDLYPSRTSYTIYTLPSGVNAIEVPFSRGYDISGRCGVESDATKANESTAFLNGIRVHLIGSENSSTYEGEVFSDGTIFVPGVAAGTYRIVFEADQLSARRLCPPATEGTVTVTETDHRIPATMLQRCAK